MPTTTPNYISPDFSQPFLDDSQRQPPERPAETTFGRFFFSHWVPITQTVLAVILCTTLIHVVDGSLFSSSQEESYGTIFTKNHRLSANDITTLVSAALVFIRIVGGGWVMSVAWRCAMLLLQCDGLSLRALDIMTTYRVPVTLSGPNARPVVIALCMMIPSVLISPILSGAVGWSPVTVHDSLRTVRGGFGGNRGGPESNEPVPSAGERLEEWLFHALGYASASWPENSVDEQWSGYRYLAKDRAPVGSIVAAVPMPYIEIQSLRWDTKPEDWVIDILRNHTPVDYANLHATTSTIIGNSLLFQKDTTWAGGNDRWDGSQPYSDTWKLGVLVSRSLGDHSISGCELATRKLWDYQDEWALVLGPYKHDANCYIVGDVTITTGIRTWDEAVYVTNRTMEAKTDPHGIARVQPDEWTKPAVRMTSSMMQFLPSVRMDQDDTRTKNLTKYAEVLLRDSYVALRSTFVNYSPAREELDCRAPSVYLKAHVSHPRVIVWLALSLLLPASTIIVFFLEKRFKGRNPIIDTPLALLLTDARNVLVDDTQGISNMSYVTKEDSKGLQKVRIGLVRLENGRAVFGLTVASAQRRSESDVGKNNVETGYELVEQ